MTKPTTSFLRKSFVTVALSAVASFALLISIRPAFSISPPNTSESPSFETSADVAQSDTKLSSSSNTTSPKSAPKQSGQKVSVVQPAPPPSTYPTQTANGYSPKGKSLYVDPSLAQSGRPTAIASQPTAAWLGGWSGDIRAAAHSITSSATNQGKLATMVIYNIPGRDCGSYSAGGLASTASYKSWIRELAAGIGARSAIVIIEPDALSQINCLDSTAQSARYDMISDAVNVLSTQTKASVYIDAGHSNWIDATTMADRLKRANVAQARGFSLNVSNFQLSSSSRSYGDLISSKTNKTYVIDSGRNGNGSNGEWCNPSGRALGERPTTSTFGNLDAYLWVKVPGESDGTCGGGPAAGEWFESYAQELIRNARL